MPKTLLALDLSSVDYNTCWDLQTRLHKFLIRRKREEGFREGLPKHLGETHYLLLCEHPRVFTLGKSGKMDHLLRSEEELSKEDISFYKINRGGDITYHGPGQLVGYPILDLDCFFTDVHKYVRLLEEVIILTLAEYGILGYREKDYTGVWVNFDEAPYKRKICAIGVHLSRWVSMHGFAFNINNELSPFSYIVPCGIDDKDRSVCSLSQLLQKELPMHEVKQKICKHFEHLFEVDNLQKESVFDISQYAFFSQLKEWVE